ncbi:MAG: Hsp20/alpha crystallin family protein [Candidatus Obscuribacterales bacterium]|nr:Hsp20/alpha crystallin family protein [Candidatus Obscuribacterales bacterium]
MLLQKLTDNDLFSSLRDMQRLQNQLNRVLSVDTSSAVEFPQVNVWTSPAGAIVRAEIPGIAPDDVEISLVNDSLTIRGSRNPDDLMEGQSCHRQERGYGQFIRTLRLPFGVEADQVQARFANGVLQITLPRVEAEKPRKISVVSE